MKIYIKIMLIVYSIQAIFGMENKQVFSNIPEHVKLDNIKYLDTQTLKKIASFNQEFYNLVLEELLRPNKPASFRWGCFDHKIIQLKKDNCIQFDWSGIIVHDYSIITSNNDSFAIIYSDGLVRPEIWDLQTGTFLNRLEGHERVIRSLALSVDNKFIVTGSEDNIAKIWDPRTGICLNSLVGHTGSINSVSITSDNKFIVTGSEDNTVKIWDPRTGICLNSLVGHTGSIISVYITKDNRFVVTDSKDNTVKIWAIQTGDCLNSFSNNGLFKKILIVNNSFIRLFLNKSIVNLFDLETGSFLNKLEGHTDDITSLNVSANNQLIVTGSKDNTAKIWDVKTGICLNTFIGHEGSINSVSISNDNSFIVTSSQDRKLKIWDITTGLCVSTLNYEDPNIHKVTISKNNNFIFILSSDIKLLAFCLEKTIQK